MESIAIFQKKNLISVVTLQKILTDSQVSKQYPIVYEMFSDSLKEHKNIYLVHTYTALSIVDNSQQPVEMTKEKFLEINIFN